MEQIEQKQTKPEELADILRKMKVNGKIPKKSIIIQLWGSHDFFIENNFSMVYSQAKKKFPDREYKCIDKKITRLK